MRTVPALEAIDLLERSEQLAALEGALAAVEQARRGRLALVRGEAGAGKTQLLRRFCAQATGRVLWSACDALFTPRPLGPLLDIGVATGGFPHDVAAALIDELGTRGPVVLVVEDAHWADEATLDVIRLVARRIESTRALVIVSYRDEQVDPSHPLRLLLGELAGPRPLRVELPMLTHEAVAQLAHGTGLDADELHARTAGNPFFVTEALAAGGERLPETVRDAVLARAARLGAGARAALDAAAIVPQRTEAWLLEALTGAVPGALDDCLRSGMLRADRDGVAFRHELARLAIEEALAPHRRTALHRAALAALTERGADAARLAHHAEAAGDAAAAVRHARVAGEHATTVGAHREAQSQYARALRFGEALEPAERADLLERFAEEDYLTDMQGGALEALHEAVRIHRTLGDPRGEANALRLLATAFSCRGRSADARTAIEEAAVLVEALDDPAARAPIYGYRAGMAMLADDLEEAVALGERAIALATEAGDVETLVRALNNVGTAQLTHGDDAGLPKLERSLAIAKREQLLPDSGRAYINLVSSFGRRREWARLVTYVQEGVEYCRQHGLEAWHDALASMGAEADLQVGEWSRCADVCSAILARPSDHIGPRFCALGALGLLRARRGDPGAWELLDEVQEIARGIGEFSLVAQVAAERAEARWLEGRPELIEAETTEALALAVEKKDPWLACELALWRRRAGLADDLPRELLVGAPGRALAGDPAGAAELYAAAGCVYDAALALADTGEEEALREAHDRLQALGARPAAALVARRLRAGGARNVRRGPRARTRENPGGLTARELEVLEVLAEGASNAEIAARLVLSEKTAGHHVSAILRKLGVRSRGQAAAEARRLGLLGG
jgi:ATP/maltotriose-dependent transcriptional regulator MalT